MLKKNFNDLALLILRVGFSGFMLTHGIPKLSKLSNLPIKFPDPLGIGSTASFIGTIIGEVIAPILIIIGVKTKLATIPAIFTMAIAAFVVHANDDLGTKEHALLYMIAFIVIFFAGPGKYAIDKRG